MYQECRHIKTSGRKCGAAALSGKPYCYFHARYAHGATRTRRKDDPFAAHIAAPLQIPLLEDRGAVQVALSDVANAVATQQIDPRRAGLLLYALQIASQNAVDSSVIAHHRPVRSITETEDGEELAPIVEDYDPEDYDEDDEEEED